MANILVTGGAGFVGSNLALSWKSHSPKDRVVALDNLKRRGSELNVPILKQAQIEFVHGDIRQKSDLDTLSGNFDLLLECSAEPSVTAGLDGNPQYIIDTNLTGTINCLEFLRTRGKAILFLSTSRVYSIAPLKEIALTETKTRFEAADKQTIPGMSREGVSEIFPTHLPRSFYGATKLGSELIIQEYQDTYGLNAIVNRCGVISGPGQFGKVDQGVFTLWVAHHYFKKPLRYTGFGGTGKQVRDLLHPTDLFELVKRQVDKIAAPSTRIYNVGGGTQSSASLCELTTLCQAATGNTVDVKSAGETTPVDVPFYVSDITRVKQEFSWQPQKNPRQIVEDITAWIRKNETALRQIF